MNKLIHTLIRRSQVLLLLFCSDLYAQQQQEVSAFDLQSGVTLPIGLAVLSTPTGGSTSMHLDSAYSMLPDSSELPTYAFPEIVVSSLRLPRTSSYSPSSIDALLRQEIESANATSLAELLAHASGISIKDYGSISGLKTISQRGLGTEHTLILLNGQRVSSMQNGLTDLGLWSVDDIESVEVVRGGQSAFYGADAVAGLINIVTRPAAGHNGLQALSSVGSFGYRRYQVSGNLASSINGIRMSYSEERGNEDFPFQFRNGPIVSDLVRHNADLIARHANIDGQLGISEQTKLAMYASTFSSERGAPGPVVSSFGVSQARQRDREHILQATLSSNPVENVTLECATQVRLSYERYLDPGLSIGGHLLDTYFRDDDIRMQPYVSLRVDDHTKFTVGTELASVTAKGNSLVKDVSRKELGAFIAGEFTVVKGDDFFTDVSVFPALRYDAISSMKQTWSPQIGTLVILGIFDAGPVKAVKPSFRSSISRNFRVPTFNELFYNGGGGIGNPALRPEHSTSADAGTTLQFRFAGEHCLQATYFVNDMTDRIVWVAGGFGIVTPKNLRRVRSEGLESSYQWDILEKMLSLRASYTTCNSKKMSADYPGDPTINSQLIYVPNETFTFSTNASFKLESEIVRELGGSMSYSYMGHRYVTEDNADFLPSHQLVNVEVRIRFAILQLSIRTKIEINNLFDEEYQVMLGYPMPLRSYRLTVGVEY